MTRAPRLEDIIDRCIDDLAAGRRTVEQCLEAYPQHREELAPLLRAAAAVRSLPRVAEHAPDPVRRASFMADLARTPQEPPRRRRVPGFGRPFGFGGLPRLAAVAAPAAAVLVLAFLLVVSGGGASTAHAATLTIFDGAVERAEGDRWVTLRDGDVVREGDVVRTSGTGRALVTFADGSTASLGDSTELMLRILRAEGERRITLEHLNGSLWVDVAVDGDDDVTYTVYTPDASVSARGLFETVVERDGTEVRAASGRVEVLAGDERTMVRSGESVRVAERRLHEPRETSKEPVAEFIVDAPFAASLIGPAGAATGARPDGVMFNQLPGVVTSDPGDGPQRLGLRDVPPGLYTLLLRRFGEGGGTLEIASGGGGERLSLGGETSVLVQMRVGVDGDGARLELLRVDRNTPPDERHNERIVQSPRTRAAIPPMARRAARAASTAPSTTPDTAARPASDAAGGIDPGTPTGPVGNDEMGIPETATGTTTGTPTRTVTPDPTRAATGTATGSGTSTGTASPPVTATATPAPPATATTTAEPTPSARAVFTERMLTAINTRNQEGYRALLDAALADEGLFEVLLETLDTSAGVAMLRAAIEADTAENGELGVRVASAIREQTAGTAEVELLQALGLDLLAGPPPPPSPTSAAGTPTASPTPTPVSTATAE